MYVSNINGKAGLKNGKGFISKITTDGKMIKQKWVDGLNSPAGMNLYKNKLYVADCDSLVVIDTDSGKVIKNYIAKEAKLLNDVTVDKKGNVYVSDTYGNAIYKLKNSAFTLWIKDKRLESPNGLIVLKDSLIVASWGVITDGWKTKTPGHIKIISLKDRTIQSLGNSNPVGNLDGIELDKKGNYFVTDWMAGKLLYIQTNGKVSLIKDFNQGSADLEYIPSKKSIFIPFMIDNKIISYQFN